MLVQAPIKSLYLMVHHLNVSILVQYIHHEYVYLNMICLIYLLYDGVVLRINVHYYNWLDSFYLIQFMDYISHIKHIILSLSIS